MAGYPAILPIELLLCCSPGLEYRERDTVHGADEHRPPGDLGVVVFISHLPLHSVLGIVEKKRLSVVSQTVKYLLKCGRPGFDEPT